MNGYRLSFFQSWGCDTITANNRWADGDAQLEFPIESRKTKVKFKRRSRRVKRCALKQRIRFYFKSHSQVRASPLWHRRERILPDVRKYYVHITPENRDQVGHDESAGGPHDQEGRQGAQTLPEPPHLGWWMWWWWYGESKEKRRASHLHVRMRNAAKESGGQSRPAGVTWCEVNHRIGYKYPLPQNESSGGRACQETERKTFINVHSSSPNLSIFWFPFSTEWKGLWLICSDSFAVSEERLWRRSEMWAAMGFAQRKTMFSWRSRLKK